MTTHRPTAAELGDYLAEQANRADLPGGLRKRLTAAAAAARVVMPVVCRCGHGVAVHKGTWTARRGEGCTVEACTCSRFEAQAVGG